MTTTKQDLIAFEEEIKGLFLAGKIRAPVHLSSGNEDDLLRIFQDVQPEDYVFSTWRSHYHALLKGIPRDEVMRQIVAGRSMYVNSKEHRFVSGSIVAGMLPIALGVALGLKLQGRDEKVWVFVGDMAARTGVFHETLDYARGHELDAMRIVIEDNGLSTNTPTATVWGHGHRGPHVRYYKYERGVPHVGVGKFVAFG